MKLARFKAPGENQPRSGLVEDGRISAFGDGEAVLGVLFGERPGEDRQGSWRLGEVTLLAPLSWPGTIYGIGLNYIRHIEETGAQRPEAPVVFVKTSGCAAPPGGPIRCPEAVRRLDYEGELALVIGQGGRIAGYCVADDVSGRDLQRREPHWVRAKGADTFCPFGPWITTADEVADPLALQLRTWVNGELRQDSSTGDMLFGPEALVDFISQTNTLRPGDLILTGTPNGVGIGFDPPRLLSSGDVVRIEIEGLGVIEHPVA